MHLIELHVSSDVREPISLHQAVLSRSNNVTVIMLELTVPLEDRSHLAYDRKSSKYSALVTAYEESGFKAHFLIEVGCLGYPGDPPPPPPTPYFTALNLKVCQNRLPDSCALNARELLGAALTSFSCAVASSLGRKCHAY